MLVYLSIYASIDFLYTILLRSVHRSRTQLWLTRVSASGSRADTVLVRLRIACKNGQLTSRPKSMVSYLCHSRFHAYFGYCASTFQGPDDRRCEGIRAAVFLGDWHSK